MAVEVRSGSAFALAQRRFETAAEAIGLADDQRRRLRQVKRELTVHVPVRMDDGTAHVLTGYRVQHNLHRGPANGGSEGRTEAAGRGLTYLTLEAIKYLHVEEEIPTVAVQGIGTVGLSAARLLHDAGMRVVAISDSKGGTHNPKGLDLAALDEHR